jgi:hypothetical protein
MRKTTTTKRTTKKTTKGATKESLPKMLEKTQRVFNSYIRNRDSGLPCISCGREGNQAGHYFTVKGFSALRFDEWNVNLQCAGCNLFLHGNQAMYRIGLVDRIGEKAVAELEAKAVGDRIKKWSVDELKEIINKYKI